MEKLAYLYLAICNGSVLVGFPYF